MKLTSINNWSGSLLISCSIVNEFGTSKSRYGKKDFAIYSSCNLRNADHVMQRMECLFFLVLVRNNPQVVLDRFGHRPGIF